MHTQPTALLLSINTTLSFRMHRPRLSKAWKTSTLSTNNERVVLKPLFCYKKSIYHTKKALLYKQGFRFESGNYLSSQRLTVSTFGVKELNFCVRNGNRWILFAIITAMVIYSVFPQHTYFFITEDLQLHSNFVQKTSSFLL